MNQTEKAQERKYRKIWKKEKKPLRKGPVDPIFSNSIAKWFAHTAAALEFQSDTDLSLPEDQLVALK